MTNERIVVVRGGPSSEHAVSMQTGAEMLRALNELGYSPRDIVVTKAGEWLEHGLVYQPHIALSTADVVCIAMHGNYGEDGTIQRICERLHIPFTGSGSLASGTAFNKHTTKRLLADTHILLPRHVLLTVDNLPERVTELEELVAECIDGLVIKPVASGSSHGVEIVTDMSTLIEVIATRLESDGVLLLEERIIGTEATCGLLEDFRGEAHYLLPVIEIVPPPGSNHFDQHVKYNGSTEEICPGRFSYDEKAAISTATQFVHTALGLSHYSRADFIVRDGQPYFLEINSLPGLTAESLFPKAAKAVGLEFKDLVYHLVSTAKVR